MDDDGRKEYERFIAKILKGRNKAEALGWLSGGEVGSFRNLGELETNEESVALVREVYGLGAVEVLAVEIYSYGGDENSGKLVIELPEDEAARGRVFAWCARQGEKLGFEGDEDFGQRYLFVMLD